MHSGVYLIGTGLPVVGKHARSVQTVLEELISEARREIIIAAYTMSGNLKEFFDLLRAATIRGVSLKIIVNRLDFQPDNVQRFLLYLSRKYQHVEVFSYEGGGELHMKVVVSDRRKAIIGSANLTWKGLTENLELCTLVEGRLARMVAEILDNVMQSSRRLVSNRHAP